MHREFVTVASVPALATIPATSLIGWLVGLLAKRQPERQYKVITGEPVLCWHCHKVKYQSKCRRCGAEEVTG